MTYKEKLFYKSLTSQGTGSDDTEKIEKLMSQGTGSDDLDKTGKTLEYKFGKYTIKIELSDKNEFKGVTEIKINKDFLEFKKKTTPKGFHDVEEFYKE